MRQNNNCGLKVKDRGNEAGSFLRRGVLDKHNEAAALNAMISEMQRVVRTEARVIYETLKD